ncbi:LysE family transporter [Niabella pedocola]|uniref:LysE family transporter n=1 Tax=Niabella pedocola TaxID=1752077 RepID=A0ABS8PTN9_9BACT|nr:LysE family transporter [Niabella pedocola]MCD2424225.1 LysE family transporter [Niabella pedocola]
MIEAFIKGITLGLLLCIAVGPVLFSVIKHSINVGHRGGLAFVLGVSTSDTTLAFISNFFSQFFTSLSSHKVAISIVGSTFLIVLGIYYAFFKKIRIRDRIKRTPPVFRKRDYLQLFLSGFFLNTLNPGIFIFWLTASTTFITHTINERLVIFITALLIVLATDIAKVMLANKIRTRLTPRNIHLLNRINGFVLMCFGIALIIRLVI